MPYFRFIVEMLPILENEFCDSESSIRIHEIASAIQTGYSKYRYLIHDEICINFPLWSLVTFSNGLLSKRIRGYDRHFMNIFCNSVKHFLKFIFKWPK